MSDRVKIHILDSTLRDGSHALAHQFTAEQVTNVVKGLDEAGVEMIEVSHGDGLGGSTVTYGFSKQSELELLKAASSVIKKAKLAVLLLPGIGTKDDLKMAADFGAKVAQIATHVTEADISEQHVGVAKKVGDGSYQHAYDVPYGVPGKDRRARKARRRLWFRRGFSD